MKLLRRLLKLQLLIGHVLIGLLLAWLLFSLRLPLSTHWSSMIVNGWSRQLCRIVGLQIRCYGHIATTPTLFVANHISWLDIFALLGTFPVIFVAKQEVAKWPILGRLTRQVGTLFIQRGQFQAAAATANQMSQALLNHKNVLFFPEGTSSEGVGVKRFHARLFQAAIQAGVPVQPIALRYPQNEDINRVVPYIGEDVFINHVWRVLGETKLTVELWFGPPVASKNKERRELADYAQQQILTQLQQQHQTFSYPLPNNLNITLN